MVGSAGLMSAGTSLFAGRTSSSRTLPSQSSQRLSAFSTLHLSPAEVEIREFERMKKKLPAQSWWLRRESKSLRQNC